MENNAKKLVQALYDEGREVVIVANNIGTTSRKIADVCILYGGYRKN